VPAACCPWFSALPARICRPRAAAPNHHRENPSGGPDAARRSATKYSSGTPSASTGRRVAGLIAYNAKGSDGDYHIYTVKPDGSNTAQLGVGLASFPQRTTGTPVWSPSGQFIAFVAEKSAHPGNSVGATPGWGSYSDLWVARADGSHAWQLTDVPTDKDHGTIIPEFSPDGGCSNGPSAPRPARP
jgi:hypothetical protein